MLITGIGGGVALTALQIWYHYPLISVLRLISVSLGLGANVYVTSGDPRKIEKAIKLGAKGGVNYKSGRIIPQGPYLNLNRR